MANESRIFDGDKPFVFISYAHKNSDRVMPMIDGLQRRGIRVWYDAQIEGGTRWSEYVAKHISGCGCFLAMITKEFLDSQNCDREIHYAINKNVPFLALFLEEVTLSEGMEMQLGTVQALFYQRFLNMDAFLDSICNTEVMRVCKTQGEAPAPETEYVKIPLTGEEILQNGEKAMQEGREEEAIAWYTQAAQAGVPEAMYRLGLYYREESEPKPHQNDQVAVEWFSKAAQKRHDGACGALADAYHFGKGIQQDLNMAAMWYTCAKNINGQWRDAASTALIVLVGKCAVDAAKLYRSGKFKKAEELYSICATYGDDSNAMYHLGVMYELGEGVGCNPEKAAQWYRKAAQKGYRDAKFALAKMMLIGKGVPKDKKEALVLFCDAGDAGHGEACYQAFLCYKWGYGTEVKLSTATSWLEKASKLNHAKAKVILAEMYLSGKADFFGVKQPEKAFQLLKENAELMEPNTEGLYELGRYYMEGIGTAVDYKQAYIAFSEAHDLGHPLGKRGMDKAVRAEKKAKRKGWFF